MGWCDTCPTNWSRAWCQARGPGVVPCGHVCTVARYRCILRGCELPLPLTLPQLYLWTRASGAARRSTARPAAREAAAARAARAAERAAMAATGGKAPPPPQAQHMVLEEKSVSSVFRLTDVHTSATKAAGILVERAATPMRVSGGAVQVGAPGFRPGTHSFCLYAQHVRCCGQR